MKGMALLHDDFMQDARTRQRLVQMGLLSPRYQQLPQLTTSPVRRPTKEKPFNVNRPLMSSNMSGKDGLQATSSQFPSHMISARAVSSTGMGSSVGRLPPAGLPPRSSQSSPPPIHKGEEEHARATVRNYRQNTTARALGMPPLSDRPKLTTRRSRGDCFAAAPAQDMMLHEPPQWYTRHRNKRGAGNFRQQTQLPTSLPSQRDEPREAYTDELRLSVLGLEEEEGEESWFEDMAVEGAPSPSPTAHANTGKAGQSLPSLPEHLAQAAMLLGVSDTVTTAAERFESEHRELITGTRQQLASLSQRPQSVRTSTLYNEQIGELYWSRLVIPDSGPDMLPAIEGRPRRRRRKREMWRLDRSCWNVRKDFFEQDWMLASLFEADWRVACGSHTLAWYITKCYFDPSDWHLLDRSVHHDGVGHVRDTLLARSRLLYGAFDYYAALHSETQTVVGEPNIYSISFNAFMSFVSRCGMVTRRNPHGDFEAIFSVVDAFDTSQDASIKRMDTFNAVRALNRQEWIQAIVRCAVTVHGAKFSNPDRTVDVAAAVATLLDTNVRPNLPPDAFQDSNHFRRTLCYMKDVSDVLDCHKASVRVIYDRYAEVSQSAGDATRDDAAMSIGEWLAFLQHLGFFDSGQVSIFSAKLIFLWSRLRSFEQKAQYTAAEIREAETRLRHLALGDFLEALVRLATLIALPTDEEIVEAGANDAGDFLIAMQRDQPSAFKEFVETHRPTARSVDGLGWHKAELAETPRLVNHLIKLIVKTVEFNTSALASASGADGIVQDEEIRRFLRMRSQGSRLSLKAELDGGVDFTAAIEIAREKRVLWTAALKIQMARRAKAARAAVRQRREEKEAEGRAQVEVIPDETIPDDPNPAAAYLDAADPSPADAKVVDDPV